MEWLAGHFEFVSHPEAWVALVTLVVLEIVLGIDNLIFINYNCVIKYNRSIIHCIYCNSNRCSITV